MPRSVVWLAGRGVSLNCGLEWDVPAELYEAFKRGELPREALARRISEELARAQESAPIDTWPLDSLLLALRKHGNNRLRAAAELGISRMGLYKKLHKYGLMQSSA